MTQPMFKLHPTLDADTIHIGDLELSQVLLMNNAHLPWLILVPKVADVCEWHHLDKEQQIQLHHESMLTSNCLSEEFNPDKLNIGALGNLVPQLHLHHIVRYKDDPVWPNPVWGSLPSKPYESSSLQNLTKKIRQHLLVQPAIKFNTM